MLALINLNLDPADKVFTRFSLGSNVTTILLEFSARFVETEITFNCPLLLNLSVKNLGASLSISNILYLEALSSTATSAPCCFFNIKYVLFY